MRDMATCSKCGKRIGLLEYVSADTSRRGLCKECRAEKKLCSSCIHYLKLSEVMGKSSVARCLKYGYDLSNHRNHVTANTCPFFSTTLPTKKTTKEGRAKNASNPKKKAVKGIQVSQTSEDFWTHFEEWKKTGEEEEEIRTEN